MAFKNGNEVLGIYVGAIDFNGLLLEFSIRSGGRL